MDKEICKQELPGGLSILEYDPSLGPPSPEEIKGAYQNTYKYLEEAQKEHDELQKLVNEHKEIIEKIKEILIEVDR
jgi:hypothetical protein